MAGLARARAWNVAQWASRGMGFQVTEVQKSLKGFDYPGDPEDLAKHAEDNGADDDLVEALRGLDKDQFDGPNAVMHALGQEDELGGPTR